MTDKQRFYLGEIADVNWGNTNTTKASYVSDGFPAYSATGQDGFLPHYDFDRTGVVVSAIGVNCGQTWLAKGKWSCIKNTIRYWSKSDNVSTEFLYWYTRNPTFWPRRGSAQPFISQGDARSLVVEVPALEIQRSISQLLGALDDKIGLNRRMNETLETMARTLFRNWFVDFGPTRAKMEGRAPYLAADLWSLFPDRLDEEGKPEGWVIAALGRIADVSWGNTNLTKAAYTTSGFPAYSAAGPDGLIDVAEREGIATVISAIGTVGKLYRTSGRWTAIKNTMTVQAADAVDSCYINYALANIELPIRGSTQQFVSLGDMKRLDLLFPDPSARHAFFSQIELLLKRVDSNVEESRALAATRDLLLPKLMSGEIRVRDAEKVVEAAL